MTDIEFIVSFTALLCGLLLANVANNIADALRARKDLPIGFVPWAINFYISAAVITSFMLLADIQETFPLEVVSLTTSLMAILPYIVVSRLLYPEHIEKWASVEDYYIANRKLILGIMLIPSFTFAFSQFYYPLGRPVKEIAFVLGVVIGPIIATLSLLILTEKPRWHRIGFGFLVAHRVAILALTAILNS
ncbi:MAG: hypothetical protein AAFN04_00480 [Pseudomonadota bacterium]